MSGQTNGHVGSSSPAAGSPLVDIFVPGEVVPFVRVGQERFTDRALAYHASKARFGHDAGHICLAMGAYVPPGMFAHGTMYVETTFYRSRKAGDGDNLHKAVLDALQGVLWVDDKQVRSGFYAVVLCSSPKTAGVHLRVWPIDADLLRGDPGPDVVARCGG